MKEFQRFQCYVFSLKIYHSILSPVIFPYNFLINRIDYLLTTESYILNRSLLAWSIVWVFWIFVLFSEKNNAKHQIIYIIYIIIQIIMQSTLFRLSASSEVHMKQLLEVLSDHYSSSFLQTPSAVSQDRTTKPSSLIFSLLLCHYLFLHPPF